MSFAVKTLEIGESIWITLIFSISFTRLTVWNIVYELVELRIRNNWSSIILSSHLYQFKICFLRVNVNLDIKANVLFMLECPRLNVTCDDDGSSIQITLANEVILIEVRKPRKFHSKPFGIQESQNICVNSTSALKDFSFRSKLIAAYDREGQLTVSSCKEKKDHETSPLDLSKRWEIQ